MTSWQKPLDDDWVLWKLPRVNVSVDTSHWALADLPLDQALVVCHEPSGWVGAFVHNEYWAYKEVLQQLLPGIAISSWAENAVLVCPDASLWIQIVKSRRNGRTYLRVSEHQPLQPRLL